HALQEHQAITAGDGHLPQARAVEEGDGFAGGAILAGTVGYDERIVDARESAVNLRGARDLVHNGARVADGRPEALRCAFVSRPARPLAFSPTSARLVPPTPPRPAVAAHRGSVPHPGLRDHAAAYASRPGDPEVSRVPAPLSDPREPPRVAPGD